MMSLLADDTALAKMAAASRVLGKPNAHAEIADALEELCARK